MINQNRKSKKVPSCAGDLRGKNRKKIVFEREIKCLSTDTTYVQVISRKIGKIEMQNWAILIAKGINDFLPLVFGRAQGGLQAAAILPTTRAHCVMKGPDSARKTGISNKRWKIENW